jgi:hypothetical protein
MSLDPDHLTPQASVNRVRIVDLPGVALDPGVRGKAAFELLSTAALAERLRPEAAALGLGAQAAADPARLVRAFDGCLAAEDHARRALAEQHARRFGRFLGYLLLTLHRGDAPNRLVREEWDGSYWAHWASMRGVLLGGGVSSGHLGPYLAHGAAGLLAAHGVGGLGVQVAAYPALLPLIGAARTVAAPCRAALVLDCGHSAIKRACAAYDAAGALAALRLLPPLAAPAAGDAADTRERQALRRAAHLRDLLADTWHEARPWAARGVRGRGQRCHVRARRPSAAGAGRAVRSAAWAGRQRRRVVDARGRRPPGATPRGGPAA